MKKFTLIELLIVVAIIGILVSILVPSLGKARYKAKLVLCKSNQKQLGTLLFVSAKGNNGRHIDRSFINKPTNICEANGDARDDFKAADFQNEVFKDPLLDRDMDYFSSNHTYIETGYTIYTGTSYQDESGLLFTEDTIFTVNGEEFDIMAADFDHRPPNGNAVMSHPDRGYSGNITYADQNNHYILRYWVTNYKKYDRNFLKTDGSVYSIESNFNDSRFSSVPVYFDKGSYPNFQSLLPPKE